MLVAFGPDVQSDHNRGLMHVRVVIRRLGKISGLTIQVALGAGLLPWNEQLIRDLNAKIQFTYDAPPTWSCYDFH